MKLTITFGLVFVLSLFAFATNDGKNVAKVKLFRGTVTIHKNKADTAGKKILKKDIKSLWVKKGSTIKTKAKSFVKLSFIDKTSMSVGPNSEMLIEEYSHSKPGMINLVRGKLRANVSKDYLQIDPEQSKLGIKTRSAVMGIRGTSLMVGVNKGKTALTTLTGKVAMAPIKAGDFKKFTGKDMMKRLDKHINKSPLKQMVSGGKFAVASKKGVSLKKMHPKQLVALVDSDGFEKPTKKVDHSHGVKRSAVPAGLSGSDVVAGDAPMPGAPVVEMGFVDMDNVVDIPTDKNLDAAIKVSPDGKIEVPGFEMKEDGLHEVSADGTVMDEPVDLEDPEVLEKVGKEAKVAKIKERKQMRQNQMKGPSPASVDGPGPDGPGPDGPGPDGPGPEGQGPDGPGPEGQGPDGPGSEGMGPGPGGDMMDPGAGGGCDAFDPSCNPMPAGGDGDMPPPPPVNAPPPPPACVGMQCLPCFPNCTTGDPTDTTGGTGGATNNNNNSNSTKTRVKFNIN